MSTSNFNDINGNEMEFREKMKNIYAPSVEVQQANIDGAEAKVTFRIVDPSGVPVKGAIVTVGLYPRTEEIAEIITGLTDDEGLFTISGKTRSYIDYVIQKAGFEPHDQGKYWVYRSKKEPCYKDGKWIPWNPIIEITLKEISF